MDGWMGGWMMEGGLTDGWTMFEELGHLGQSGPNLNQGSVQGSPRKMPKPFDLASCADGLELSWGVLGLSRGVFGFPWGVLWFP